MDIIAAPGNPWISVFGLFIAAFCGPASAVILAWLTGRQVAAAREVDFKRQDQVAQAAREAADLLASQAALIAQTAAQTAHEATSARIAMDGKLDVIHTLVNSQLSTALQNELDALVREVAMMRELIELKQGRGNEPTPETLHALSSANDKILVLQRTLIDRKQQTELAAAHASEKSPR